MLKKTLFILLAVGMLFAGITAFAEDETESATATPAPLLYNGSMEGVELDADENVKGTYYWGVLDDGATIAADTNTYYGESGASMKVSGRLNSSSGAMQYVTLTNNTTYTVSVYVRADTAETFKIQYMKNYWEPVTLATVTTFADTDTSYKTGEWVQMTGEFTYSSDWGDGFIRIVTNSTNDFYIDDVSITLAEGETAATASQIVTNGDMESYDDDNKIPYYWGATDKVTSCLPSTGDYAYSGTYGIKVTGRNLASDGLMQYISLTSGKTYVITAYVKTAETDTAKINVRYNFWSDDVVVSATTTAGEWTKLMGTYTVRTSDTVTQIVINTASTTCNFYVDDVSIIDVDTIVIDEGIDLKSGKIVMDVYVDSDVIDTSNINNITTTIGGKTPDLNHAVVVSDPTTEDSDDNTFYTISQKIMASQMADIVAITIPLSGGGTYTYTTSVKNYAAEVKSGLDTSEQTALTAMLDYGSAVQELAAYQADATATVAPEALANGGEYPDLNNINADTIKSYNNQSKSTTAVGWTNMPTFMSMNMNFNYNFNLGLTFSDDISGYTVSTATIDGEDCEYEIPNDYKNSIVIRNLTAAQLSKRLVVTLTDSSDNTYQISTTPLYYARLLLDTTTDNINGDKNTPNEAQQKVGKTLYLYVKAIDDLTEDTETES